MLAHDREAAPKPWLDADARREAHDKLANDLLAEYQGTHRIGTRLLDAPREAFQRTGVEYVRTWIAGDDLIGRVEPNFALKGITGSSPENMPATVQLRGDIQIDELTGVVRQLLIETKKQGDERRVGGRGARQNVNER